VHEDLLCTHLDIFFYDVVGFDSVMFLQEYFYFLVGLLMLCSLILVYFLIPWYFVWSRILPVVMNEHIKLIRNFQLLVLIYQVQVVQSSLRFVLL